MTLLLYSNDTCGKITGNTHITRCDSIVSYEIISRMDGFEVYVHLVNGDVARLITKPSYNEAVAVVEKIEREASGLKPNQVIDIRFVQVHQDH